jgi:hypothetical protein
MYLRLSIASSYAALAAGDVQMLRQLLLVEGKLSGGWRSRLLLCYAARHSSAECLQEVLAARQTHIDERDTLVAPQHLDMAAARTDSWAAGGHVGCLLSNSLPQAHGDIVCGGFLALVLTSGNHACNLLSAPVACIMHTNDGTQVPARTGGECGCLSVALYLKQG